MEGEAPALLSMCCISFEEGVGYVVLAKSLCKEQTGHSGSKYEDVRSSHLQLGSQKSSPTFYMRLLYMCEFSSDLQCPVGLFTRSAKLGTTPWTKLL